jgi:hypothetical protein
MIANRITNFLDDDDAAQQAGAILERFQYDPYATTPAPCESSQPNIPWAYPVQSDKSDPVVDATDCRIRTFHTAPGRWLEHDPITYAEACDQFLAAPRQKTHSLR